jgi:hypothetical protein
LYKFVRLSGRHARPFVEQLAEKTADTCGLATEFAGIDRDFHAR